jgi:hypothetical protein
MSDGVVITSAYGFVGDDESMWKALCRVARGVRASHKFGWQSACDAERS